MKTNWLGGSQTRRRGSSSDLRVSAKPAEVIKRRGSSSDLSTLLKEEEEQKQPGPFFRRTHSTGEDQKIRRKPRKLADNSPITTSKPNSGVPRAQSGPARSSRPRSPKRGLVRKLSNKSMSLSLSAHGFGSSTKNQGSPSAKSPSGIKVAKDMLRESVMAPINVAAWTGKAVVDAGSAAGHGILHAGTKTGQAVVQAGAKTGHAVVEASTKTGQAVVQAGSMTGHAVVQAGTMASTVVVNTGSIVTHGVVDAGNQVGNSVVSGSKAILGGTTNTVVHGGKSMVKNSVKLAGVGSAFAKPLGRTSWGGMVKNLKQASIRGFAQPYRPKQSKWEEGIETIDELLDPECAAYQHMTQDQRLSLQAVKKLLLKGTTSQASKMQHVPAELILMQSAHGHNFDPSLAPCDDASVASMAFSDVYSTGTGADSISISPKRRKSMQRSSTFILEEYAGLKETNHTLDSLTEHEQVMPQPITKRPAPARVEPTISGDSPTASLTDAEPLTDGSEGSNNAAAKLSAPRLPPSAKMDLSFLPPEFSYLDGTKQAQIYDMLKWDSISKWDFNIFEMDRMTGGHAMLYVGYAILGAPYSQKAMARELGVDCGDIPNGYNFLEELQIPPQKLYNYIKVIEKDYNSNNPYHNHIHGADVLQTLHTMIQKSGDQEFMKNCSKLQLFSVLISALVHDVAHFGTTNAFHNKLQTELAVLYNDKSVMENWHVAHAFSRMFDLDLTRPYHMEVKDVNFSKFQQSKSSECNILCNVNPEQFLKIRKFMIDAILHTDMTKHFEMVNSARGMLISQDDESVSGGSINEGENAWQTLVFMLHMADISGQAKIDTMRDGWTKRCFDEFFAQGDQETALGMAVSPNCDRFKVMIPESQMGFIKFVVEPAFEVLGSYIPFVHDIVLPIINDNMLFYLSQQQEADAALEQETTEEFKRLSTLPEGNNESMSFSSVNLRVSSTARLSSIGGVSC